MALHEIDSDLKTAEATLRPPTLPVQDALATQAVAKEMTASRLADTDLDVAKKLIGIAETTLSSIQSRAGLVRMEASLTAYQ